MEPTIGTGRGRTAKGQTQSPNADEIDLYITATDLWGLTLPIRLADKVVWEQRYRNVFHFRYATASATGTAVNDFHAGNHPFLAFAARCTSAFPFAFEPMCLKDIDPVLLGVPAFANRPEFQSGSDSWKPYYQDYLRGGAGDFTLRAFGDGGYLDNYPFSYAIDALQHRQSDLPVQRKLLYVEPSPGHPEQQPPRTTKPDVVENVLMALSDIPRAETIREDLQRVLDRNRLIDRLSRITADLDTDVTNARRRPPPAQTGEEWASLDLADLVQYYGAAYGPYQRLKVYGATDALALLVTMLSPGLDENSDQFQAVRYVVRAWRESRYASYRDLEQPEKLSQNQFLLDYDLDYRFRRLFFLQSKIDQLYCCDSAALSLLQANAADVGLLQEILLDDPAQKAEFQDALRQAKRELNAVYRLLSQAQASLIAPANSAPDAPSLASLVDAFGLTWEDSSDKPGLLGLLSLPTEQDREAFAAQMIDGKTDKIQAFADILAKRLRATFTAASASVIALLETMPVTPIQQVLRITLVTLYQRYEDYDLIAYPLTFGSGVGEPVPVDVHRVSPEDAVTPFLETFDRKKLAGTTFGHFGAFLQRFWRVNDLLWGRLDGAERLIRALTPALATDTQNALISEAQRAIIREEVRDEDRVQITGWLVTVLNALDPKVLARENQIPDAKAVRQFLSQELNINDIPNLQALLQSFLTDEQLEVYLGEYYTVDRTLIPEPALRLAARTTAVLGRMMDGIARSKNFSSPVTQWMPFIGKVFIGVVEAAVPRSLPNLVTHYWFKVLYLFEALLISLGWLLGATAIAVFGEKLLFLTALLHYLITMMGRMIRGQRSWRRAAATLKILGGLLLLILVGDGLVHVNADWATAGSAILRKLGLRREQPPSISTTITKTPTGITTVTTTPTSVTTVTATTISRSK